MNDKPARQLLQKIPEEVETLLLESRAIATNALTGLHRSPYRGSSIEFREHREYQPGDDLRRLDWRVFAKSDRLYVKQFEDETTLNVELVLDTSMSMDYSSAPEQPTKFQRSQLIAAALADIAIRQGDAVRCWSFSHQLEFVTELRRQESHLFDIAQAITKLQPSGADAPSVAFDRLASKIQKRSLVVIISDVLFDIDTIMLPLRSLKAKHFDINLFRVNDPQELDFDFTQPGYFECPETDRQTFVHPNLFRKAYQKEWERRELLLEESCRQAQITLQTYRCDQDPAKGLQRWIEYRQRALR